MSNPTMLPNSNRDSFSKKLKALFGKPDSLEEARELFAQTAMDGIMEGAEELNQEISTIKSRIDDVPKQDAPFSRKNLIPVQKPKKTPPIQETKTQPKPVPKKEEKKTPSFKLPEKQGITLDQTPKGEKPVIRAEAPIPKPIAKSTVIDAETKKEKPSVREIPAEPVEKKEKTKETPDLKEENLEQKFKDRQKKLQDLLNNDQGNLT